MSAALAMGSVATVVSAASAASPLTATAANGDYDCQTFNWTWVDEDGDQHTLLTDSDSSTERVRPGKSLDALEDPPQRLAKFGIPPRPAPDSPAYASWLEVGPAIAAGLNVPRDPKSLGGTCKNGKYRSSGLVPYTSRPPTAKPSTPEAATAAGPTPAAPR